MLEPSVFGRNLRRLRESRGLSQNALAKASGVSQGFVNNLEAGYRLRATTDTAQALARALGVTVDELLRDAPQEAPGGPLAHDASTEARRPRGARGGRSDGGGASMAATVPQLRTYRVVLEPEPDGSAWNVSVPALPGCFTWGHTVAEALERAQEAITGYLEALAKDGGSPSRRRTPTGRPCRCWRRHEAPRGDWPRSADRPPPGRVRAAPHPGQPPLPDRPWRWSLVTVALHAGQDVPPGTLRSILRQAGLTVEEFTALL